MENAGDPAELPESFRGHQMKISESVVGLIAVDSVSIFSRVQGHPYTMQLGDWVYLTALVFFFHESKGLYMFSLTEHTNNLAWKTRLEFIIR